MVRPEHDDPRASQPGSRPDAVEELVADALEAFDLGGRTAVEDVLSRDPVHSHKARRAVERLLGCGLLDSVSQTDPLPEAMPERLGDFDIVRKIGGGGMGMVFLARQRSLDRDVALKLVRPDQLFFSETARRRFQREVHAVSRLDHPGIVPVWHVGEEGGIPYFVMEVVQGASLGEVVDEVRRDQATKALERRTGTGSGLRTRFGDRRGAAMREALLRLRERAGSSDDHHAGDELFAGNWEQTCLRITLRVAEAVAHAHEREILHRDLKPSNIMLTATGQVRLVDFGLAMLDSDERLTRTEALIGSLHYMPPEQLLGERDLDGRADVYALGATLYELLTLRTPFGDSPESELRERVVHGDLPPVRRVNAQVSRDAETICGKAMAPRREQRYSSIQAFAEDLRNRLHHRPIAARPPTTLRRAERWVRRNALLSMALLLLAVTAASFAALYLQQRSANASLAEANRIAGRNLERTKDAIQHMLRDVGARELKHVPQMTAVRRRLIKRAVTMYGELAAEDPSLNTRGELAVTQMNLGNIELSLANFDQARDATAAAVEILTGIVEEEAAAEQVGYLARALSQLALIEKTRSHPDEAESLFRAALAQIDRMQSLATEHDRVRELDDSATVLRAVANFMQLYPERNPAGEGLDRESISEMALRKREAQVELVPDNLAARGELAREYWHRADHAIAREDFDGAMVALDRAVAHYDSVADAASRHLAT